MVTEQNIDDSEVDDLDDDFCWACNGTGEIVDCVDDLCHGTGECIHEGNQMCIDCGGLGHL